MLKWLGLGQKQPAAADTSTATDAPVAKITTALAQTSYSILSALFQHNTQTALTDADFDQLEDTLIRADVGVDLAVRLTDTLRQNKAIQTQQDVYKALQSSCEAVFSHLQFTEPICIQPGKLLIILVVGVNGAGKTTLIGKLAHRFVQQGKQVLIAAGDTFRAAAEEQLDVWATRAGATLITQNTTDAGAVVFEALQQAKQTHADALIIDTAGRLHNQFNLMEELSKIQRIISKEAPTNTVQETLLVVDANTGQNGLQQAKLFNQAVGLTGVALTKLDGSAKGGIVLQIADQLKLSVKLVGVGEKITDLQDFTPEAFIQGIFGHKIQHEAGSNV